EKAVSSGCRRFYASLAGKKLPNTTIISRIQRNAELYDLPVKPKKKGRGRPRKKGKRVLCPQKLAKCVGHWQKVTVCERGKNRTRLVHSKVLLWYRVSQQPILLVISRDPEGKEKDDFFFTTDVRMSPAEVIGCYADRWAIEDTFKNTKQYLGSQQPQTFKGQGPERAAGLSLWLYSMVWLWYLKQKSSQRYFMVHPWNPLKCRPSFADAIGCLRRELWRER
ncbi:MAG: transposase, partial [Nitrospinaceae bacterium]|nr:transposase [Nitrospinaceae bacterium]